MKFLTLTIICLMIIGCGYLFVQYVTMEKEINPNQEFSGPIRPTDDEAHFRATGETKPLVNVNG